MWLKLTSLKGSFLSGSLEEQLSYLKNEIEEDSKAPLEVIIKCPDFSGR